MRQRLRRRNQNFFPPLRLTTGNGYDVTVHGVLMSVRHLLDYQGPGGYFTPSKLLGPRCIEQLPGSASIVIN